MRKNLLCTFALLSSIFFSGTSRAQSAPTVSYTNPVNGPVGTSIKIVGNNFGSTQSSSTIAFNGTTATPTSWSNTQIVAPVPTGATTGPIVVTVGGVASNHVNFTVGTPPTISYTNPVNGPAGTSVTIVGTYFGATLGTSTLAFNGTSATPTSWSSTQIVAPVPSGATTGPIIVTVGGVASNHVNFTVGSPPTISYTNPIDGPVGTTVTVVGNYFGSTQGSSTITFNGTPTTPTSWSNTQIIAAVPTGAVTGPVVVSVRAIASNHVNFIVGTPPTISYTNPIDGPAGTSITIVGNYFGSAVGNVTFNGTGATPANWNNTQIVVPVPNGASTGPLVVTAGGMASNHVNFIVGTPPTISYTNPVRAAVGSSITIVGNYFGSTVGNVTFNGTAAAPSSWSNTQIVLPIPNGASTGPLVVTAGGMASNSVNFTVVPNITSLSPPSGPFGTTLTITGTTFGLTQGSSTVTFNGTQATPASWTDTQIAVPVPNGASSGPVVVTTAGIASNAVNFSLLNSTPSIVSISPSTGGIGATVTLVGSYFGSTQNGSTVAFNGIAARVTNWSDGNLTARVPSGLNPGAATVNVSVNQLASNGVQFTVTKPLFVTPNRATLLVGNTRAIQLLDENGALISNPTWSFDNSSIAEIIPPQNPGDPVLLQADAVGTTTLTASYGDRTGVATISVLAAGTSFPIGTIQWSLPSLGSFGISKSVQSLRVDDNTPDLYVEDDGARGGNGSIRALTADGQQKWIWPSAPSDQFPLLIAADDQGGAFSLVFQNTPGPFNTYCYYGRVDQNGNETWQYQASNCQDDYAIHPDGTIFLVEPDFQATNATVVVALDPTTGQIKFTVPTPGNSSLGSMSISSDGSLFLPVSTNVDLQLMVIQSDGSYSTQQLDSTRAGALSRPIPDGQGGVLLATSDATSSTGALYHTSASGTLKFNLPFNPVPPGALNSIISDDTMLLGQDGTAYLVASSSDASASFADTVEAIDTNSGAVKWTAVTPGAYSNLGLVTSDGSLAFQYYPTRDFSQHFVIANSTGQVSPLFANPADGSDAGPVITHLSSPLLPSYWTLGTWHAFQNDGSLAAITGPIVDNADAYSQSRGNEQGQTAEPKGVKFEPNPSAPAVLSAHCTGLDDTKNQDPRWLMVPLLDNDASGSNTVLLKVKRGWENVLLKSADPLTVTISPDRPTNNTTVLTLTGSKVGVVDITAIDSNNPSSVKATLRVSVKPKTSWIVSLFGVTEKNSGVAPTNIPDAGDLSQYLNSAYGKQANIFFSVNPAPTSNLQIPYDLDNNRRLNYAGRSTQGPEADAIINYMLAIPKIPAVNEKWVFYVHEINPTTTQGFAGPGAGFLEDQATNGQVQKTAHELGHTLGIGFNSNDKLDLMYEFADGSQPCRIPRSQWKLINPTPNDNASTP